MSEAKIEPGTSTGSGRFKDVAFSVWNSDKTLAFEGLDGFDQDSPWIAGFSHKLAVGKVFTNLSNLADKFYILWNHMLII